jgi:hypothetical protein
MNPYDEDYFLHGKQTGKSLYENYRWMPELTLPMVSSMVRFLGIDHHHHILDFGCARGYVVRAFREMGYHAWGVDCSEWAVQNCDETVSKYIYLGNGEIHGNYDWIIVKDVLEHVTDLLPVINEMQHRARCGIFVVVPLSAQNGNPYVCGDYERDITHIHRMTLHSWGALFCRPGWSVDVRYHLPWIKQNWHRPGWEKGNGFITARRID